MQSADFSRLKTEHPQYVDVWSTLESWIERNSRATFFDPRVFIEFNEDLPRLDIVNALKILVHKHLFKITYRLVDPMTDTLIGKDFDTPAEIPENIESATGKLIRTDDIEVVPVLHKVV